MREKAIILESPVEFALVGPYESRDKVLVRSKDAGLDLIGLAAQAWSSKEVSAPDIVFSLWNSRQLNVVRSFTLPDVSSEVDSRPSSFSFVWTGLASKLSMKKIEKVLNLHLPDLRRAIKEQNVEQIEWAIAPVIYNCTRANEQRLRFRRLLLITGALYGFLFGLAVIAAILASFIRKSGFLFLQQ